MRNLLKRKSAQATKTLVALMLAVCMLASVSSAALAAVSAGSSPSALTPSSTKTYIKLSRSVLFFTGNTYGTGSTVMPPVGAVCQMYTDNWYTASDGLNYYNVYYNNQRYNVLRTDVYTDIMTEASLQDYITNTYWKQASFDTLRKTMNLVGDIRVHAVQLALQKLGHYSGALDGNYGEDTHNAVKAFQKSQGLEDDGSAGPLTQPILFNLASGGSISSGTVSGGTTVPSTPTTSTSYAGTLRTRDSVNLRKSYTTNSAKLHTIPQNINLTFSASQVNGGDTWYKVTYDGETGWVVDDYVTVLTSTGGGSTTTGGTAAAAGSLTTNVSVNLRRSSSTSSLRLAVVPKGMTLSYTSTVTVGGITWYQVSYNGNTGWLMGTYVSAKGNASSPAIGTVTITKKGTRVRTSPNGTKSGTVLAKGTVVDLLAQPTTAGSYTWYNIRTSSGLVGFVRGDCATASLGGTGSSGSSSDLVISTDKSFIKLPANTTLFKTETKPASGGTIVSAGTVLMMYSTSTYTNGGVEYCSVYYNNEKYNAVYSEVKLGIMTSTEVASYVQTLINSALSSSLKDEMGLKGDVRVYAMQVGLKTLGYYTGNLDGTYGTATRSAVRNFQRATKIDVDGDCGTETWTMLRTKLYGSTSTGGTVSGGTTTTPGVTVTDFGTVTSVQKANWNYDDNGATLFPKGTYGTVMDVQTGKVFQVYRWSGGSHADCVPASAADTKTMCDIVGFPYNPNHPTSAQLELIKADGDKSTVTYTWPDFKNAFGGAKNIGAAWDARSALLNVNGKVYPVGIYGFPHGFDGVDSFSKSKFPNGQYFYAANNYYGMMCLHFVGSTTHSGNVSEGRQKAINEAYAYAQKMWPTLCK